MLEGGTTGGCSILHTLEIRLGFRMIIGASRVLLFRRYCRVAGWGCPSIPHRRILG
jgi:hypothetical protein